MPLTERTIEREIDKLKKEPGTFQRIVEYYAELMYPHRFREIVNQGRDHNDVPVPGWPDAYSLSPSGRMDVVEATHSPAWAEHLEEDLENAEALGKECLSGFLFVAWANEPTPLIAHKKKNPRYELLRSYRNRLIALDVPAKNINFVFKKQLIRSLTKPRFTAVLTEILELPGSSSPFKKLSANKVIFGTPESYDVFAPSIEEYEEGLVHRAAITDEVEKRLDSSGWAWLRGRGAAGKTVLAIHIGLGYEKSLLPAYYVDLSKTDVSLSDALNVITTHADPGVLFIIDNVHLNQDFARDCFDRWKSVGFGSRLLLIGRDTTTYNWRGTALPLDDLKAEALILKVTQEDLKGVFLRLMRRGRSSLDSVPSPPQDVLQQWHKLFGGDLIAFTAAAAQRLKQLAVNDWTMQAQDAARYVQRAYLAHADEAERRNLLRLAAGAQLETDVPEEALEAVKIEPFLASGLVHFVGRGRNNRYGLYRLVHPGLGDLLLSAAGYADGRLSQFIFEQFQYIAKHNPIAGSGIAARLESANRTQEAAVILKGIVESENGFEVAFASYGLQYTRNNSERLIRLGVLSKKELNQKLTAVVTKMYAGALRTPLKDLASFLKYAEQHFPAVWHSLVAALQRPEALKVLNEEAVSTPLTNLHAFFDTEIIGPKVLASIHKSVWDKSRLNKRLDTLDSITAFANKLHRFGRSELLEAPVISIIKHAEPQHWHLQGVDLDHLSTMMQWGQAAGAEAILNFLTDIATLSWLEEKYATLPSHEVAAALFRIWGYHEEPILALFRTDALKLRVRNELKSWNGMSPENLSGALRLLGVSALIGMRVDDINATWPDPDWVNDAARITIPDADAQNIGQMTIQFWVGLRVMAALRPDRIRIEWPWFGDSLLRLWKNSTGTTTKQSALNNHMIDWMERCAARRWELIPEPL